MHVLLYYKNTNDTHQKHLGLTINSDRNNQTITNSSTFDWKMEKWISYSIWGKKDLNIFFSGNYLFFLWNFQDLSTESTNSYSWIKKMIVNISNLFKESNKSTKALKRCLLLKRNIIIIIQLAYAISSITFIFIKLLQNKENNLNLIDCKSWLLFVNSIFHI